jgi:hypothetical protein
MKEDLMGKKKRKRVGGVNRYVVSTKEKSRLGGSQDAGCSTQDMQEQNSLDRPDGPLVALPGFLGGALTLKLRVISATSWRARRQLDSV